MSDALGTQHYETGNGNQWITNYLRDIAVHKRELILSALGDKYLGRLGRKDELEKELKKALWYYAYLANIGQEISYPRYVEVVDRLLDKLFINQTENLQAFVLGALTYETAWIRRECLIAILLLVCEGRVITSEAVISRLVEFHKVVEDEAKKCRTD